MVREFIDFIISHSGEILDQTIEHLWLTLVSLLFAVITGMLTGVYITRNQRSAKWVIGLVNAVQTIPSLALLGFMIPLLGIGPTPAIVALFLYALLPIVRNTFTGINEVEASIKEAAKGMGLTDYQVLTRVELPLATPVIFAGIRTAFVINVGVATLAALIAAGGLGEFIFRGIALNNGYMIMAGALPAALLALTFDFFLGIIQKHIKKLLKPLIVAIVTILLFFIPYKFLTSNNKISFVGGFPSEFIEREDGLFGLQEAYGFNVETVELEIGLMYMALDNKDVDLISGFSTDGRIDAYNLRILKDDKNFFPPYHVAPIVNGETMRKYPELQGVFWLLSDKISDQDMIKINFRVDNDKISPKDAALEFLKSLDFKTEITSKGDPDILVGSKNFTESFILAEMFKIMIENYTDLTVELKMGFGGTKLVFDALDNGEIDIYPEYTGTGLLVILPSKESIRKKIKYNREEVLKYVTEEFSKQYDIIWMPPLGFNNTHAMMMREEHAARLNISTISELKAYLEGLE